MTAPSSTPGQNPYAPPAVAETEASGTLAWKVEGTGVLARNGTTLPPVDLDSGAGDVPMTPFMRVSEVKLLHVLMGMFCVVGGYFGLNTYFDGGLSGFVAVAFVGSMIWGRLRALSGRSNANTRVWTFREQRRAKRIATRRWFRIGSMVLTALSMIGTPLMFAGRPHELEKWFLRSFGVGIPMLVILIVWAVLDRERTKVRSGPQGWLRIDDVHPDALAKLREIEMEMREKEASRQVAGKRLVKTSYYHRYPLRLLIGKNWNRPLLVFNIVLMKLLRSRLLERETYHFSEAEEVPLDGLREELGKYTRDWSSDHPDWILVSSKRLPNPAGDVTVDRLVLASPGFGHCLTVSDVWTSRNQDGGTAETTFLSWTEEGRVISTVNHATLKLGLGRLIEFRSSGPPSKVFTAHLGHCEGHRISAADNAVALLGRIERLTMEAETLLIEAGLQGEVRESG